MAGILNVPSGSQARAIHVQQIINWLRGLTNYSEAVSLTGISSDVAYALTAGNRGTLGLGFAVRNSDLNKNLLEVKNAGVTVRGNGSGTLFRVRNLADDADLFAVTDTGVTVNGLDPVTRTGNQTLTNKTLTQPVLQASLIGLNSGQTYGYTDLVDSTTPPNPSAGILRLFESGDVLKFQTSAGVTRQLATLSGSETFTNKTLTSPSMSGPVIANTPSQTYGYTDYAYSTTPPNPSAGYVRTFVTSDDHLHYLTPAGADRTVATLLGAETLGSKTLSIPTLTMPVISLYADYGEAAAPSAPGAGFLRLYTASSSNLLSFKTASATKTLADLDTAQVFTNKTLGSGSTINTASLTSPVISNYLDLTYVTNPGSSASAGRIYGDADNNVYWIPKSGSRTVLLTSANTPAVTSQSYARSLMSS